MKNIFTALTVLTLAFVLISCGGETQSQQSKKPETKKVEQTAPDNNMISFTVKDTEGNIRNSSEWIGKKPVVINIWGTWCPPCRAEIPAFVKAYDIYSKKGVEIIGIAVKDTPEKVTAFASQNNMNWEMMMFSSDELIKRFKIEAVPTSIFVDRTGKIMQVRDPRLNRTVEFISGAMHYDQFVGYLDSLVTL